MDPLQVSLPPPWLKPIVTPLVPIIRENYQGEYLNGSSEVFWVLVQVHTEYLTFSFEKTVVNKLNFPPVSARPLTKA